MKRIIVVAALLIATSFPLVIHASSRYFGESREQISNLRLRVEEDGVGGELTVVEEEAEEQPIEADGEGLVKEPEPEIEPQPEEEGEPQTEEMPEEIDEEAAEPEDAGVEEQDASDQEEQIEDNKQTVDAVDDEEIEEEPESQPEKDGAAEAEPGDDEYDLPYEPGIEEDHLPD